MRLMLRHDSERAWTFRVGLLCGAFYLRSDAYGMAAPASLWFRWGRSFLGGPGWHLKFFERATDYRPFSERQGITKVRTIGPLTIRRLTP